MYLTHRSNKNKKNKREQLGLEMILSKTNKLNFKTKKTKFEKGKKDPT